MRFQITHMTKKLIDATLQYVLQGDANHILQIEVPYYDSESTGLRPISISSPYFGVRNEKFQSFS